mmetsp:Transcript_68560/g.161171  ORF Transcript_68560/g.161171 Transcript_68560/m.161171 type:complete len:173 (+) Transcript_68560:67-585(+)
MVRALTVLVSGSRNWSDRSIVHSQLTRIAQTLPKEKGTPLLVHGNCRGLDLLAASVALELKWEVSAQPAEWSKLGRRAGPIRNQQMLDEFSPDICLAFPFSTSTGGTVDMIRRMRKYASKAPKPVTVTMVLPMWVRNGDPEPSEEASYEIEEKCYPEERADIRQAMKRHRAK